MLKRGVKKIGDAQALHMYNIGVIINGCKTTKIYCRPNCPPGRRTKRENRVQFGSFQEAKEAGFRACMVCKPEFGEYGAWVPKGG